MRILLINDKGINSGGSQIYLSELKKNLKFRGHIVKIISSNLDVHNKSFSDYTFKGFNTKSFLGALFSLFNPYSYFAVKEICKKFKPDIVHLNYIFGQTSPSVLLCLRNIPKVITLHGLTYLCPLDKFKSLNICNCNFGVKCISCLGLKFPYYALKNFLYKRLDNIDCYIAVSNYIAKQFYETGLKKIKVIHNKIHLLNSSKINQWNKLLYVGRLEKEKGAEILIRAIQKIICVFPDTHLSIIGDGAQKKSLLRLTNDLKLGKHIKFFGKINHETITKFYKRSTIVIIPSIGPESFSLVGIEAMSAGRPIIASNVGGIPEWLKDKKTGYLVDPGNANQITERVIELLSNRKLLQKMGNQARITAESKFNINFYIDEIENVYKSVLSNKKYKISLKKRALKRAKYFSWEKYSRTILSLYKTLQKPKNPRKNN
ncbi:MAG: glycosyltransferase family 4 protein [Flavobacterium sp.]|uniref:glycosyltransferase family 4 protein n=1 Tax=Flavobacterium sp. TaxID=239 RepID=UPI0026378D6E|nr:glycosyltransferase family 4 protein [Flavobacterium sp.]MDD5149114.1 glycosyltransferase family 4 protein [Flavobacterium sp.]